MEELIGLDASEYQDPLPWADLKAQGLSFAILRASIGYLMDLKRLVHSRAADLAGVPYGWYHALWDHNLGDASDTHPPTIFDPRRQARVFCQLTPWDQTLIRVGGVFLPRYWVDVEAFGITAASLAAFLDEWDLLRPETVIGIYTSKYFWQQWGGHGLIGAGHPEFALRPLWVADYRAGAPALPDIWPRALIHQWRYKPGYFPTYPKALDINVLLPQPEAPVLTPNHIKLGPHHMQGGDATGKWLKLLPRVAKFETTDLGASVEALPGTLALGRANDFGKLGGQGFDPNRQRLVQTPAQALDQYRAFLQPYIDANRAIQAWEGPNEPVLRSSDKESTDPAVKAAYDEDRKQTVLWYGEFCYLFAQWLHTQGKIAVIGSWASGQPRVEDNVWQYWGRALQASRDFGALQAFHDYAGDIGLARVKYNNAEWSKLGYPNLRQVITELGVNEYGGGWKSLYADWNDCYARLIKPWLDAVYALPFEVDATWFTDGTGGNRAWDGLDVSGTNVVELLAGYQAPPLEETMPISRIERQALLDQANSLYTQADAQRTNALALVSKIVAIVPDDVSHWWDAWPAGALNPPRQIAALPAAILMRDAAGVPLVPNIRRGNAMQVFERQGNLLRVLPTPINGQLWWVRAEDLPVPAPAG